MWLTLQRPTVRAEFGETGKKRRPQELVTGDIPIQPARSVTITNALVGEIKMNRARRLVFELHSFAFGKQSNAGGGSLFDTAFEDFSFDLDRLQCPIDSAINAPSAVDPAGPNRGKTSRSKT